MELAFLNFEMHSINHFKYYTKYIIMLTIYIHSRAKKIFTPYRVIVGVFLTKN